MTDGQFVMTYAAQKLAFILTDPIFWLMQCVVIYLYQRERHHISGVNSTKKGYLQIVFNQCVGLGLGTALSGLLAYKGVILITTYEILWLIPLALVLMAIQPKWGCFSYVVTVAYLIEGLLQLLGIHLYALPYETLILLVGILHLMEGTLICLQGSQSPLKIPVYKAHYISWTYVMFQMWIVPLVCYIDHHHTLFYTVLAYRDVGRVPYKQKYITGLLVILYGMTILLIGYLTVKERVPVGGAIILMPLLHEFIFVLSHPREKLGHIVHSKKA